MPYAINKIERIIAYTGGTSGNPYTGYTPHATDIYLFDGLGDDIKTTEQQITVLQQSGVDGQSLKITGTRAKPSVIPAERYLALASDWSVLLRELQDLAADPLGVAMVSNSGPAVWPIDIISVQKVGSLIPVVTGTSSVQANPTAKVIFVINCVARPAPLVP